MNAQWQFEGVTIVVTGGAQGIGRAISCAATGAGANVIVLDSDARLGARASEELGVTFHHCDVGDFESIETAFAGIRHHTNVTGLVNCAAAFLMDNISAPSETWERMFAVNVSGYAKCATEVARLMGNDGSIVNVASISARIVQQGLTTYSTTKAAVVGLSRMMAMELAPRSIRVNSISPGTIWSANNARIIASQYGVDRIGANRHPELGGKALLGRVGLPEEVAEAVLFLLSDSSSFMTAADLVVDGGYSVRG